MPLRPGSYPWPYLLGNFFLPCMQHDTLPVTGPNRFSPTHEILETPSPVLHVALRTLLAPYLAQFKELVVTILPDRLQCHWKKEDGRRNWSAFLHRNDAGVGRVQRDLRQQDFR